VKGFYRASRVFKMKANGHELLKQVQNTDVRTYASERTVGDTLRTLHRGRRKNKLRYSLVSRVTCMFPDGKRATHAPCFEEKQSHTKRTVHTQTMLASNEQDAIALIHQTRHSQNSNELLIGERQKQ
jgi:hypothetical protein